MRAGHPLLKTCSILTQITFNDSMVRESSTTFDARYAVFKHITIVYFVVLQKRKETQNRENAIQYDFIDSFRKIASLLAGNTIHTYRKNNINNSSNNNNKNNISNKDSSRNSIKNKISGTAAAAATATTATTQNQTWGSQTRHNCRIDNVAVTALMADCCPRQQQYVIVALRRRTRRKKKRNTRKRRK